MIWTKSIFIEVCETLWGRRWKVDAAVNLGISQRSVRRYAAGERVVPRNVRRGLESKWAEYRVRIARLDAMIDS
jgi:hypothetical protein